MNKQQIEALGINKKPESEQYLIIQLIKAAQAFESYASEHLKKHGKEYEKYNRNLILWGDCAIIAEGTVGLSWDEISMILEDNK